MLIIYYNSDSLSHNDAEVKKKDVYRFVSLLRSFNLYIYIYMR